MICAVLLPGACPHPLGVVQVPDGFQFCQYVALHAGGFPSLSNLCQCFLHHCLPWACCLQLFRMVRLFCACLVSLGFDSFLVCGASVGLVVAAVAPCNQC